MKGAREIIERAMNASGLDNVQTQDACDVIEAITAAGYRILAPGEVDDIAAAMWTALDDQSEELKARWRKFARAAIRTPTDGGHDA